MAMTEPLQQDLEAPQAAETEEQEEHSSGMNPGLSSMGSKVSNVFGQAADSVKRSASRVAENMSNTDMGAKVSNAVGQAGEVAENVRGKVAEGAAASFEKAFAMGSQGLKSMLTNDPDMFQCVRSRIEFLVDLFWKDLTLYAKQLLEDQKNLTFGKATKSWHELGEEGDEPMCCGFAYWRAFFLYHYLPYDRSSFGQVKDPVFWMMSAISLVPMYGVRVIFFAFVFLMLIMPCGEKCKPDQHQLVTYILGFKGTQFIANGVVQACIAAVKYYICVHPGGTHTCDKDGPGQNQDLISGLVDFVGSTVLTWLAFAWLKCSKRYTGMRDEGQEGQDEGNRMLLGASATGEANEQGDQGGRLASLWCYDVVCFLLSCCFGAFLTYVDVSHMRPGGLPQQPAGFGDMRHDATSWEGHTSLFWVRVFSAFLSFPFVFFSIPMVKPILTRTTTATGFNRKGACVRFVLPTEDEKKKKKK